MNEVQINTLAGNFWEQVVEDELNSLRVRFDRSPNLGAGIISPDFVCRKNKTTIFVTCTGSSQSFIKKRWRYINELFQAKAVLGEDMLVANLVLASSVNLQQIEEKVFKGLFDQAVFGNDFPNFEEHYLWVRSEIRSGTGVLAVAAAFQSRPQSKRFRAALRAWLNRVLKVKPSRFGGLWAAVEKYQSARTLHTIIPNDPTYWRWTCLKLLPLKIKERRDVVSSLGGKVIKTDVTRLNYAGFAVTRVIGGVRVNDETLDTTLGVFDAKQLLSMLSVLDADNASIGFPLHEVVDEAHVKTVFFKLRGYLADQKAFTSFAQKEFSSPTSERISIWEYAVALAQTSLLDVNKEFVKKWGKIVVANPINNVILKTDISETIAMKAKIDDVISRASSIMWKRLPKKITEALFIERVMDYRKRSLFLQPYLNPTQRHFESVCNSVFGTTPDLNTHEGLLGDIGIKGRASRIEAVYVLESKSVTWIFKVLSGYKGGYEHKADEMASRAWLLRFRISTETGKAFVAPVRLAFVYEGEWDTKYLSLLHASGWDEIIHLSQVENFLKTSIK